MEERRVRLSGLEQTEAPGNVSVEDARRMFARTIGAWASDVLWLRKRRLDRPSVRWGRGHEICDETAEKPREVRRRRSAA